MRWSRARAASCLLALILPGQDVETIIGDLEEEDASRDRRAYRLTPLGRRILKQEFERMKHLTRLAGLRLSGKKASS